MKITSCSAFLTLLPPRPTRALGKTTPRSRIAHLETNAAAEGHGPPSLRVLLPGGPPPATLPAATALPVPLRRAAESPAATPPPPAGPAPPEPGRPPPPRPRGLRHRAASSLPPCGDTQAPGTAARCRRFPLPAGRPQPRGGPSRLSPLHRDPAGSLRPAAARPVRAASLLPPWAAAALGSLRPAAEGTGRAQVRQVAERGRRRGPAAVPAVAAGEACGASSGPPPPPPTSAAGAHGAAPA